MNKKPLSRSQYLYYNFYIKFIEEKGYKPTLNEMSIALGKSRTAIWTGLNKLEELGYI